MVSSNAVGWKRQAIALLLFGISFGYVEAAVVTYLRPQFGAVRARFYPQSSRDDLFPLLSFQQVKTAGREVDRMVETEVVREVATLFMLGAAAAAASGDFRQWFAFFLIGFGAWDISYYAFLKVLIDWPRSLLAWDILFLIPVPWSGPVLAPVLVSLAMVFAGFVYLWRESTGHPMHLNALHWTGAGAAALLILAAFTWDFHNVMGGGMPNPFHWPLFALGEALAVLTFLHALRARD